MLRHARDEEGDRERAIVDIKTALARDREHEAAKKEAGDARTSVGGGLLNLAEQQSDKDKLDDAIHSYDEAICLSANNAVRDAAAATCIWRRGRRMSPPSIKTKRSRSVRIYSMSKGTRLSVQAEKESRAWHRPQHTDKPTGDITNDLLAISEEPNVRIFESKGLTCNVTRA